MIFILRSQCKYRHINNQRIELIMNKDHLWLYYVVTYICRELLLMVF